ENSGAAGWRAGHARRPPAPGAAWDLEVTGHRAVAGRRATVIVARDDSGRLRARFAVDRASGQLLYRAVVDRHGHVVRSVGFESIVDTDLPPLVPSIPPSGVPVPHAIQDVPDGYPAPDAIANGYRLLGRSRLPDGTVQLYYGDG